MAKRNDILIDENWNFKTFDGDIDCGQSVLEDAKNILFNAQGDWRKSPLLGAALRMMLNAPISLDLNRVIRLHLDADGVSASSVTGELDNLNVVISNERF